MLKTPQQDQEKKEGQEKSFLRRMAFSHAGNDPIQKSICLINPPVFLCCSVSAWTSWIWWHVHFCLIFIFCRENFDTSGANHAKGNVRFCVPHVPRRLFHEMGGWDTKIFLFFLSGCQSLLVPFVSLQVELKPLRNNTADEVARALVGVFSSLGIPEMLIYDQGTEFANHLLDGQFSWIFLFLSLCGTNSVWGSPSFAGDDIRQSQKCGNKLSLSMIGVHHRITTAYYPQPNGMVSFSFCGSMCILSSFRGSLNSSMHAGWANEPNCAGWPEDSRDHAPGQQGDTRYCWGNVFYV